MDTSSDTSTAADPSHPWLTVGLVIGCPLFVVGAVTTELFASQFANSESTGLERWFPLSWAAPGRVAFWLVVAAAAGGFRWGLARLEIRQHPLAVVLSVAPFVLFSLGIATGSSATTWH